jgi:pimeloyl-ACP methyl ester carboxylesterase
MPTVDIDGVALDYVEQGIGPPLVFIHGGISDRRFWEQQIDVFAERYAHPRSPRLPTTSLS